MTDKHSGESPETEDADAGGRRRGVDPDTPHPGRRADDTGLGTDLAPRRTPMAAERTYLAWLRTGLGALAVAIAVGRLAPALLGGSHSAYALLGAGYGVLGVFFIVYAVWRAKRLDAALAAGIPVRFDWWALAVTTVIGLALAMATIVMVLAEV